MALIPACTRCTRRSTRGARCGAAISSPPAVVIAASRSGWTTSSGPPSAPSAPSVIDTGFTAEEAERRGRTSLRSPAEALALVGVDAATVEDVVLTHCHYDHIGTVDDFPNARLHIQESELQFASGRYMQNDYIAHSFNVEEVTGLVRDVFSGRTVLHDGDVELGDGLSIHRLGGHTGGNQVVRVRTARGWVVLASDAAHYYDQLDDGALFAIVFDVGAAVRGYQRMHELGDSPAPPRARPRPTRAATLPGAVPGARGHRRAPRRAALGVAIAAGCAKPGQFAYTGIRARTRTGALRGGAPRRGSASVAILDRSPEG